MQKIKSFENLLWYLLTQIQWQPFIVVSFDHFQQVAPQNLKYHAEMVSIVRSVNKSIQQANYMSSVSSSFPGFAVWLLLHPLKDLNLVKSCLHVVRWTFLYFSGHIGAILEIFAKPYSWKMSPSQFLNNNIPIDQNLADMNRMVSPNNIVVYPLIFRIVILIDLFQKLSEIALLIKTRGVTLMIIPLLKCRISDPIIYMNEGLPYSNMDLNLKWTNRLSNTIRKHHEIVVNILVRLVLVSLVISLFDL